MHLLVTDTLKKKVGAWIRKPVSIWCDHHLFASWSETSPSHKVDQVVDCDLWNVVPLLLNGCVKLLDIGGNWNTLSYTLIQSITKHAQWATCLVSMQAMEELGHFQLPGIVYRSLRHGYVH